jgi:hypothetical protein
MLDDALADLGKRTVDLTAAGKIVRIGVITSTANSAGTPPTIAVDGREMRFIGNPAWFTAGQAVTWIENGAAPIVIGKLNRAGEFLPGLVFTAQVTTPKPSGIVGSVVDISSLSGTIVCDGNRKVQLRGIIPAVFSTVANDVLEVFIREGSTTLTGVVLTAKSTTNADTGSVVEWTGTPTAGSHTYKLSAQRVAGTGSMSIESTAARILFFNGYIEQ